MIAASKQADALTDGPPSGLHRTLHLERDLLRVPLSGPTGAFDGESLWYWKQLNHLASEPTRTPVDLSHFDPDGESPFTLTVQLRGWSDYASSAALDAPDHWLKSP